MIGRRSHSSPAGVQLKRAATVVVDLGFDFRGAVRPGGSRWHLLLAAFLPGSYLTGGGPKQLIALGAWLSEGERPSQIGRWLCGGVFLARTQQ